ncbi:MAG: SOS response-associated peptidase [Gammaproteobacteria bacterium]|jgi:putative SOS response-associated peptidase YedK
MCGRYAYFAPPDQIARAFGLADVPDFPPHYNVAPTQDAPVIRDIGEGRQCHLLHWGLIPFWAKDASVGNRMINARAETVSDKPAFRRAFRHRRCLVPASGFYEWRAEPGGKQPWFITLPDGEPMAFAGLWERWDGADGTVDSFTILTTDANPAMRAIHERMPVILPPDAFDEWLKASSDPEHLKPLLVPYRGPLLSHPVSRRVNSPRNDGPDLVAAVGE